MKAILLFIFSLIGILAFSQAPTFDWAKKWGYLSNGQISGIYANDMVLDSQGNSYVLSYGNTQVNFNTTGTPLITAPSQGCGAISKFDGLGNLIWVKFIVKTGGTYGSCTPQKIKIKGNYIYYSGKISTDGLIDFDFSNNNSSLSGENCFISKIDLDGNFQWVKSFGNGNAQINDISVDYLDNLIATGKYQNSISLASQTITSNGSNDVFVAKWDTNGNPIWVKGFGGTETFFGDSGNGIATSTNGDIYVVGNFGGSVDFDPSPNTSTLTSNGETDLFIQKLNALGNLIWVKTIGGNSSDFGNDIIIDSNNELVFTGLNTGVVDFNPGASINNLNNITSNAFICKWDENANFIWAKAIISSSNSQGSFITSDLQNNYYITGKSQGTADFDPSNSGIFNLTASGGSNTFILKLTTFGDFNWAGILFGQGAPNNYSNEPTAIHVNQNSIYISGGFKGQVDFNTNELQNQYLTSSVNNSGVPDFSAYVLKLNYCPSNSSSFSISQCQSYTWSTNNTTYSASGTYTDTLVNIFGCDSIITLNLTILPTQSNSVSITQCDSYTSPLGNTYNSSGSYTETYSNVNGCDSIVTINLTITNIQNTVTVSACGNYISPLGNNYNSSGTYQENYTTSNGCDSLVTIQLTINNSITINETKTACSSYLSPSGNTYTQSGQYYDTLITSLGCDSIIITQLTIFSPSQSTISPVVCSSFTSPSGIVYNQTGTYIDTLQNLNGCDSIITINLSVVGTLNVNAGPDITICSGESITLNGAGASAYSWSNGVSNNIPFSPTVTTNYEVIGTDGNGCS